MATGVQIAGIEEKYGKEGKYNSESTVVKVEITDDVILEGTNQNYNTKLGGTNKTLAQAVGLTYNVSGLAIDINSSVADKWANAYTLYKDSADKILRVPTIQYLNDAIKNPSNDMYAPIVINNKINGIESSCGIGSILAYGNYPVEFISGAGKSANVGINNALDLYAMPLTTFSDLYAKSTYAARDLGDIQLVGNFELGYCGPLDARTLTPSRNTLKDPDWWITSSSKPVYLYRGMLVAIKASQELVMYRGADIIIDKNNATTRSALDDNKWTLISQSGMEGTQTLDTGETITINTTLDKELPGNGHITYDTSINVASKGGVSIISLTDPDTGTAEDLEPDTIARLDVSTDRASAEVKINVSKETDNSFKYTGLWNLAGVTIKGEQTTKLQNGLRDTYTLNQLFINQNKSELSATYETTAQKQTYSISAWKKHGIKLTTNSSIWNGSTNKWETTEKNIIHQSSDGIELYSLNKIDASVNGNAISITKDNINLSGNVHIHDITINKPDRGNTIPYFDKDENIIKWKESNLNCFVCNTTANRGIFKIAESICTVTTSPNVNSYDMSSIELDLTSSAYKGRIKVDLTIYNPKYNSQIGNKLVISDNTTSLNGGPVKINDSYTSMTPTNTLMDVENANNPTLYQTTTASNLAYLGDQIQRFDPLKNLWGIGYNSEPTIYSYRNKPIYYAKSSTSPIIVLVSYIPRQENEPNYNPRPYKIKLEIFLVAPAMEITSFAAVNTVGSWDISGLDNISEGFTQNDEVFNQLDESAITIFCDYQSNKVLEDTDKTVKLVAYYSKAISALPDVIDGNNNEPHYLQYIPSVTDNNPTMIWITGDKLPNNIKYSELKNNSNSVLEKYYIFGKNNLEESSSKLEGELKYSKQLYYDEHGDLFANNYYSSSDERFKDNIDAIKLKTVKKNDEVAYLLPNFKQFKWKESGEFAYGLIALELEENFKELVYTDNASGFKSVNYIGALSYVAQYLIEENKKLTNKIDDLINEIEIIKEKIK